jgi:uncharacterized protein (DUF1800 family)
MGDENTILDTRAARHLLRRTGFGATTKEIEQTVGQSRGDAVNRLLSFNPRTFRPTGADFRSGHNRWIKALVQTRLPLQAKLALFWHDHFATAIDKVQDIQLMATQIQTLYRMCTGSMKDLVKAINIDPAMMEFLDTVRNRKQVPNENYGRELLELFTLGVFDLAPTPQANYTQADIVQIARAFTGWDYDNGKPEFLDGRHDYMADYPARGPKVIFQSTGGFGGAGRSFTINGESEDGNERAEIDAVIDIIFDHTDSQGKNTVARRTARRLLEYFAHADPDIAVVDAVVASSGFATNGDPRQWSIAELLRAIFVHDAFYESSEVPLGPTSKRSIKAPVDYVVSTLRILGMRFKGRDVFIDGGGFSDAFNLFENMGQQLLNPPSVFGWDWETAWISSSTLLARYGFARDVSMARGRGTSAFRPERLRVPASLGLPTAYLLDLTSPAEIVDTVTEILGVKDDLTSAELGILIDYVTDDGAVGSLDLHDDDVRNEKLHGLFALVLQSPAYNLH